MSNDFCSTGIIVINQDNLRYFFFFKNLAFEFAIFDNMIFIFKILIAFPHPSFDESGPCR